MNANIAMTGLVMVVGVLGTVTFVVWSSKALRSKTGRTFPIVGLGVSIFFIAGGGINLKHQITLAKRKEQYDDAIFHYQHKEFSIAEQCLSEVIAHYPEVESILQKIPYEAFEYYHSKAEEALEEGQFDAAIEHIQKALGWNHNIETEKFLQDTKKKRGQKWYEQAKGEYTKGRYEMAQSHFARAESLGYEVDKVWSKRIIDKGFASQYYEIGRKEYEATNYQGAVIQFQRALNLNPGHSLAKKWLGYANKRLASQYYAKEAPQEIENSRKPRLSPKTEIYSEANDWAYKLATINAGTYISKDHHTVRIFERLLNRLEHKCTNSRQQISDMSVRCWELLNERGRTITLLRTMQALDESIPAEAPPMDLAAVAALFLQFMK